MASVSDIVRKQQRELGLTDDSGPLETPLTDRSRSRVEQHRDNLHGLVNSLPADALGSKSFDWTDRNTWYLSEDPKIKRMAEELYGITEETAADRLSNHERTELHKAADAEADAARQEHFDYADQIAASWDTVAKRLYADQKLHYPADAANPQAVREAVGALMQGSGMSTEELLYLANQHPFEILERIHERMENDASGNDYRGRYYSDDDDNRTGGTSYGGGSAPSMHKGTAASEPDKRLSSMSSAIREWQLKTGYHS